MNQDLARIADLVSFIIDINPTLTSLQRVATRPIPSPPIFRRVIADSQLEFRKSAGRQRQMRSELIGRLA